jgi:hypothetical protein
MSLGFHFRIPLRFRIMKDSAGLITCLSIDMDYTADGVRSRVLVDWICRGPNDLSCASAR